MESNSFKLPLYWLAPRYYLYLLVHEAVDNLSGVSKLVTILNLEVKLLVNFTGSSVLFLDEI